MSDHEDHINNYYLLVQLSNELAKVFENKKLHSVNEFKGSDIEMYFESCDKPIKIHLGKTSFAFLGNSHSEGGRKIFRELESRQLIRIEANYQDRSFRMVFDNNTL